MTRSPPISAILLAPLLTGLTLGGCVDHPDFLDSQKIKPWESTCEGEAPTCWSSCDGREALTRATCQGATWSCAQGIRAALCCDPSVSPDHCELWRGPCSPERPCPAGYTCVDSRSHPVPAESGLCRLGDLSIPEALGICNPAHMTDPALIPLLGTSPVKLEGVINVEMTCEDRKCTMDNPCCQSCSGAYHIELHEPDGTLLSLPIRTESLSCAGTNCGFSCSPMQAGRRYLVWGLFIPGGAGAAPGTLHHAGHCAR